MSALFCGSMLLSVLSFFSNFGQLSFLSYFIIYHLMNYYIFLVEILIAWAFFSLHQIYVYYNLRRGFIVISFYRLSFAVSASKIKEKARVVAMDLRGHGESSTDNDLDLSIEVNDDRFFI